MTPPPREAMLAMLETRARELQALIDRWQANDAADAARRPHRWAATAVDLHALARRIGETGDWAAYRAAVLADQDHQPTRPEATP